MTTRTFPQWAAWLLTAMSLGAVSTHADAQVARRAGNRFSGQIIERCGITGQYQIGKPADTSVAFSKQYSLERAPAGPSRTQVDKATGDELETDARSRVLSIRVARRGVFTQRYIVIGESKLSEVIERYGKAFDSQPNAPRVSGGREFQFRYPYEGVSFTIRGVPANAAIDPNRPATYQQYISSIVEAITLHYKAKDPSGRDRPCTVPGVT